MINNLQHKQLVNTTKIIAFYYRPWRDEIQYNGITTHFILYSVSESIGNYLSMVKSMMNWKLEDKYYTINNNKNGRIDFEDGFWYMVRLAI